MLTHAPAPALSRKLPLPMPQAEGPLREIALESFSGFGGTDKEEVRKLLELSFGKSLVPGYFELPAETVIQKGSLGLAIVKSAFGENYLDKFAVHPDHRGNGIARELWKALGERYDSLIWRSRTDNPINCWYKKNSNIEEPSGKWIIFAYGLSSERFRELVPLVSALPETFIK